MENSDSLRRLRNEQEFHNEIFESDKRSAEVGRFYSITEAIKKSYEEAIFDNPKGKYVLEYGCGMGKGDRLTELAEREARVYGIDISDYAIDHLAKKAKSEGHDIHYEVMNAEKMTFKDNYFDIIYGSGILHHLDLSQAFSSISKKLKENGKACL